MAYRVDFTCNDDDPLQQFLNGLYDYRDDIATKVLHRCRLNLFWLLLEELKARGRLESLGSALDIGCNAGMYSGILSDCGFLRVLGIDIDQEMIRKAQRTFGSGRPGKAVEFRLQRAEDLDLNESFDFVLCTEVIEHTWQPETVIANLKSVMAPRGLAVISLPNRLSLPYLGAWAAYTIQRRPKDELFERHLDYPFYRSIRLFSDPGLDLVGTDGTNLFWDDRLLRWAYGNRVFPSLNRLQFRLARRWPFKFVAQFFYVIVQRA